MVTRFAQRSARAITQITKERQHAGWLLEEDEHLPKFNELVKQAVSVLVRYFV